MISYSFVFRSYSAPDPYSTCGPCTTHCSPTGFRIMVINWAKNVSHILVMDNFGSATRQISWHCDMLIPCRFWLGSTARRNRDSLFRLSHSSSQRLVESFFCGWLTLRPRRGAEPSLARWCRIGIWPSAIPPNNALFSTAFCRRTKAEEIKSLRRLCWCHFKDLFADTFDTATKAQRKISLR